MDIYIVLYDTSADDWEIILVTCSKDDAMDKLNNSYANCIQVWDDGKMISETIYDCRCEFCKSKTSYTSGLGLFGVKQDYKIEVCESCRELLTDPCFSLEQIDRIMKNVVL
jgi:hypothetical protein